MFRQPYGTRKASVRPVQEIKVADVEALSGVLTGLPKDCLFRGQIRDHRDAAGRISIRTSQARYGCNPKEQFKWSHYASFLLDVFFGEAVDDPRRHREQALLQHYGWRSFFIDATSNPAVAAWFASHSFSQRPGLILGRDCFGDPLATFHVDAEYVPHRGTGYLYAVSRSELEERGATNFDLAKLDMPKARLRPKVQSAWLISPPRSDLPLEAIVAVIEAPASVFAQFAASLGLHSTPDLFPTRQEDPILDNFLALPWLAYGERPPLPTFVPGLKIPEYDLAPVVRHPSHVGFYKPFSISKDHKPGEPPFSDATFLVVEEALFHMRRLDGDESHCYLRKLLKRRPVVVMESEHLMRYPPYMEASYMKGVAIKSHPNGYIEVCEVVVDHPGMRKAGFGTNRGRYYEWTDGDRLQRVQNADECPCQFESRHQHHLSSLGILDDMLASDAFVQSGDREFRFVEPNNGDSSVLE